MTTERPLSNTASLVGTPCSNQGGSWWYEHNGYRQHGEVKVNET